MRSHSNVFFFLMCLFIACLLILFILVTSMPFNPIKARYSLFSKSLINSIIPEGWGFFTKSPVENKRLYVFDSNFEQLDLCNSSLNTMLGVSRKNRIINAKFALIADHLVKDSTRWLQCPKDFVNNISQLQADTPIKIKVDYHDIPKGIYYLRYIEPLPWSWIDIKNQLDMPSKVCKVFIE